MYAAVGWALFGVGNVMRFVSMRFAAQTVLSGLGSLQFVLIPIASRMLLGIRSHLTTVLGVATVLLGEPGRRRGEAGPAGAGTPARSGARGRTGAAPPAVSSCRFDRSWAHSLRFPCAGNVLIILYGPPEASLLAGASAAPGARSGPRGGKGVHSQRSNFYPCSKPAFHLHAAAPNPGPGIVPPACPPAAGLLLAAPAACAVGHAGHGGLPGGAGLAAGRDAGTVVVHARPGG